jgi:mono/diheme cytochrome c family protein
MFRKLHLVLVVGIVLCLTPIFLLRRDPSEPNLEVVMERQMARTPAFGAYADNPNFPDKLTLRQPVPGTIPQGVKPFHYGPTPLEAARAGKELKNPLSHGNPEVRKRGAMLYANYCQSCHGEGGLGDGAVSRRGFPAPLSFLGTAVLDMPDGEMFHILTHGKGNMPPHALQLSSLDRWAVILHVRVLQKKFTGTPNVRLADTIKLFKNNCAACHSEDGTGSLMRARLPNLPNFRSLAWQLSQTNLEIINRIEYGDEPLMPSFRYQLPRDQILALGIYIRSFATPKNGAGLKEEPLPKAADMKPVQIFRAYCLACHNTDGKGAIVRLGMPDIPDFTSVSWHDSKKEAELAKSILSGGKFMPPMKDKLSPADAERMAKFVRNFKDPKFVVKVESSDVPKIPVPVLEIVDLPLTGASIAALLGSTAGEGPLPALSSLFPGRAPFVLKEKEKKIIGDKTSPEMANRLRAAAVIFRTYCIACHGPDGTGVPAMRLSLPTLPDFTNPSFQEQHSDPQLMISILDGKGTLMPANRGRVNETQARDLAAYIRTFGPPGSDGKYTPPTAFQQEFERLQRQWEALERDLRNLKKQPGK